MGKIYLPKNVRIFRISKFQHTFRISTNFPTKFLARLTHTKKAFRNPQREQCLSV